MGVKRKERAERKGTNRMFECLSRCRLKRERKVQFTRFEYRCGAVPCQAPIFSAERALHLELPLEPCTVCRIAKG